jgi:hypothetical protein
MSNFPDISSQSSTQQYIEVAKLIRSIDDSSGSTRQRTSVKSTLREESLKEKSSLS